MSVVATSGKKPLHLERPTGVPRKAQPADREWHFHLQELKAFKRRFGHAHVPPRWRPNPGLAKWAATLRSFPGRLSDDQLRVLLSLGFDFIHRDRFWLERYIELTDFHAKYGHCRVPESYERSHRLLNWTKNVRARRNSQAPWRIKRLDALGFSWDIFGDKWEQGFEELQRFKMRYGHCQVSVKSRAFPDLGIWLYWQRYQYRRGRLPAARQRRLEKLGFRWEQDPNAESWEARFAELVAFHKRFGHCRVRRSWHQKKLVRWVNHIRERKHRPTGERKRRLDALGFEWTPYDNAWDQHFAELARFKKQYGHCRVPFDWKKNISLGRWVSGQRKLRKQMPRERRQRLEKIGFVRSAQ